MMLKSERKKALVIGKSDELMAALPYLLYRAGFLIDIITPLSSALRKSSFINQKISIKENLENLESVLREHLKQENYDWIIPADDPTLEALNKLNVCGEVKQKTLPVVSEQYYPHLFSKTQLSFYLEKAGIPTPSFFVSSTLVEAKEAAKSLGFPIALKRDQSGGGLGVYRVDSFQDLEKRFRVFNGKPVLVQKWIDGPISAIDALYLDAKLIYFAVSDVVKEIRPYGPSSVRFFRTDLKCDQEIIHELEVMGKALGIHGFVNISFVVSSSHQKRYYYEADVRPTVWIDMPRFFYDDLARLIQKYFLEKKHLFFQQPASSHKTPIVPHYLRIGSWELLFNRYGVWRHVPWSDFNMIISLLQTKFRKELIVFVNRFHPRYFERAFRRPIKRLARKLSPLAKS